MSELCASHLSEIPPLDRIASVDFPMELSEAADSVALELTRLRQAVAFTKWRKANHDALASAFLGIVGRNSIEPQSEVTSIRSALALLRRALQDSKPTADALGACDRLFELAGQRRAKLAELELRNALVSSLDGPIRMGPLVETQLQMVQTKLDERTKHWRREVYQKSQISNLDLASVLVNPKGELDFKVGLEGVTASAHYVANASAHRANLVSFFLAFREHVLTARGGLYLLILDDPQELLDDENRERLADALPHLVAADSQLFVTTHNADFARMVAGSGNSVCSVEHRSISAVSMNRGTICLPLAQDGLAAKFRMFERLDNEGVDQPAQDYIAEFRIFLEARLGELFREPASADSRLATLADYLGKFRAKVTAGYEFFTLPKVRSFIARQSLSEGSDLLKLLNRAHHAQKHTIRFIDVHNLKCEIREIQASILDIHLEYKRWCKREESVSETPPATHLTPLSVTERSLTVVSDLAAYASSGNQTGVASEVPDTWNSNWFNDKCIFQIASHNFGWAAPYGTLLVVESAESFDAADRELVISYWGDTILARRLFRCRTDRTKVALAAETIDPTKGPPTRMTPMSRIRVHRVAGVLFMQPGSTPGRTSHEAIPYEGSLQFSDIQLAFQITGESALPLARPGQTLLGGKKIVANEFGHLENAPVALALADGTQLFKRVSKALPNDLSHIRQFESIGGLGDSCLAAVEDILGRRQEFPVIVDARQILGVLYT